MGRAGSFIQVSCPICRAMVGGEWLAEDKLSGDQAMIRFKHCWSEMAVVVICAAWVGNLAALAQPVQHLSVTQPGGFPGLPVMQGIQRTTNGVQVAWDGPSGYYQVYQKSNSLNAKWIALGKATNLLRNATITTLYSNAFFRVSGPSPQYAGSRVCISCHLNVCRYETNTPHASAFSNADFQAAGGQTNRSCLPCHTVGYGLPTGFVSASQTPLLAGVQCENCHGPAGNHAANEIDPTVRPRVELAATVCGGCHSWNAQPTYQEWSSSEHAAVVPGALRTMSLAATNINNCGVCHSGSVRMSLINGVNPIALTNDLNVAITCAVCHDPHATNANPVQLRGPVASTNNFHLLSSDVATVAAFTNKYNASTNIILCAQCHNDRGAAWTDNSAPHFSVQYNFLLGSVGELLNGPATFNPGTHAGLPASAAYSLSGTFYLTNQCVDCHMQTESAQFPGNVSKVTRNHSLQVASDTVCLNCHLDDPELLEQYFLTPTISSGVAALITGLNRWADTRAPAALKGNGIVAWEYTRPGGLTWQTNSAGFVTSWSLDNPVNFTGPNAAGQGIIATNFPNVARARFNLYLVLKDGSFGVHNPALAINLLNAAQIWVQQALQ